MLLTYQEAAKNLNVSLSTFRRIVDDGGIAIIEITERCHRVESDSLERYKRSNTQWRYKKEEKPTGATLQSKVSVISDPLGQPKSARLKRAKLN